MVFTVSCCSVFRTLLFCRFVSVHLPVLPPSSNQQHIRKYTCVTLDLFATLLYTPLTLTVLRASFNQTSCKWAFIFPPVIQNLKSNFLPCTVATFLKYKFILYFFFVHFILTINLPSGHSFVCCYKGCQHILRKCVFQSQCKHVNYFIEDITETKLHRYTSAYPSYHKMSIIVMSVSLLCSTHAVTYYLWPCRVCMICAKHDTCLLFPSCRCQFLSTSFTRVSDHFSKAPIRYCKVVSLTGLKHIGYSISFINLLSYSNVKSLFTCAGERKPL